MKKIKGFIEKYFWWIISCIGAIQIWLISGMTIYQLGDAVQDNMLMITYAQNLGAGNWLGAYNNNTLLKRISYPIFLAICNKLHIPYLLGLGLFWTFCVVMLIIAFRKILKNKVYLLLLYIYILFNPVMYSSTFAQVIYRNAIIPGAVVLVVASLVGLFTRRNEKTFIISIWSVFSGLSFAFFWNIREDSIWLLPFYIVAILLVIVYIIHDIKDKKIMIKKIIIVLMSIACVLLVNNSIKLVNYVKYGVYTDTELFDTGFRKLMNLLTDIDEKEEKEGITVSRNTLNELFEVSPTLKQIEPYIGMCMYDNYWQLIGDNVDDGEIYGGYFFWALRDAVQEAGFYESGKTADKFYTSVCNEINEAIYDGKLSVVKKGFSIAGIELFSSDANKIFEAMFWNIDKMLDYEGMEYATHQSDGNKNNLRTTELITRNQLAYKPENIKSLSGWIVPQCSTDEITLSICDAEGKMISNIELAQSEDVYKYFYNQGIINEAAHNASFSYSSTLSQDLFLHIYINDIKDNEIKLDNITMQQINTDKYTLYIGEAISKLQMDSVYIENKQNDLRYNKLINIYKILGNTLAVVSVVMLIVILIISIVNLVRKKDTHFYVVFILLGIFLSYLILIYGVSAKYYSAIDSNKMWGYLGGTSVLQAMFIGISITYAIYVFVNIIKERKQNSYSDCK